MPVVLSPSCNKAVYQSISHSLSLCGLNINLPVSLIHTKHRTKHGDSGGPHLEDMKVTIKVDTAANDIFFCNQVTNCARLWWLSLSRTPCSWRLILLIGLLLPLSSAPTIFLDRQYIHTCGPVTQWISNMPDDNPLKPVSGICPPPSLNVDSNICENWKLFKQKRTNYAVITQLAALGLPGSIGLLSSCTPLVMRL